MSDSKYIFTNTARDSELKRLQAIERVFDPASRQRILATGLTEAWHCLEVGAGAGSIAKWMAEVVGANGEVVAVDLDTRFLTDIRLPNVRIIEGDIRDLPLEVSSFDLIHARYVLIHLPNFQEVLSKLVDLLKPGGWLAIEEPDFSAARAIAGGEATCQSFARINQAILRIFGNKGIDYDLGIKLPAILQKMGLQQLSVEHDAPASQGGSELAMMMKMSTAQLAEQYLATGEVTLQDIENYDAFAENPNTWAIYYATVRISAQKAIAAEN
ncbi:Methyltransferase type 11 [Tumidithrix helvetica PCC 7403]|uniref:class I SAM-dependent methyltransferase n=1 Tax=Tumidithrix helvetica TaxID=3457545 RepID=UPI003CAC1C20